MLSMARHAANGMPSGPGEELEDEEMASNRMESSGVRIRAGSTCLLYPSKKSCTADSRSELLGKLVWAHIGPQ
jgi:hypothetical protein